MVAQCYDQGGNVHLDNFPCDPDAETSACCGAGSQCVNNLYCVTPWNSDVPGTCTDQNWGTSGYLNPSCPCPPHYLSDGSPLSYLGDTTLCSTGGFVCGINNATGCTTGTPHPIIFYNNASPLPSSTAQLSSYYSGNQISTATLASKSTTATITAATSSPSSSGFSLSGLPTSTNSLSVPTGTTAAQASNANSTGGLDGTAKIGLGVGIALGVLVLALLAALIVVLRRRGKSSHAPLPTSEPAANTGAGGYGGVYPPSYGASPDGYHSQYAYHSPEMQTAGGPGELEAYAPMLQKRPAVVHEAAAAREPGELSG